MVTTPLLKETDEGWRSMFANNLDPVFYLAQAALPGMKKRGFLALHHPRPSGVRPPAVTRK